MKFFFALPFVCVFYFFSSFSLSLLLLFILFFYIRICIYTLGVFSVPFIPFFVCVCILCFFIFILFHFVCCAFVYSWLWPWCFFFCVVLLFLFHLMLMLDGVLYVCTLPTTKEPLACFFFFTALHSPLLCYCIFHFTLNYCFPETRFRPSLFSPEIKKKNNSIQTLPMPSRRIGPRAF